MVLNPPQRPAEQLRGAASAAPQRPRRPGRPAAATPAEVVAAARAAFLAGERIDVQSIAAGLGLSRASVYRWFGSREGLLGAVLAGEYEALVARADSRRRSAGGARVLEVLARVNRWMSDNEPFRHYFEHEQRAGLRTLTAGDGPVQPRAVRAVEELVLRAVRDDGYAPPMAPDLLAYAMVRLGEAFLYNDSAVGITGDVERLRTVQAALLGLPADS
ncbi:QsdR family transcriptional regulator [Nocardia asteroides]|uniref:QsdR family transcriptional regulator n=1 Tax=Nocardia asteroides TaxID=1824 RepID=UPI001E4435B0|nr:QsdR family transcriptional regulator [Nocardia asteroides]UGT61485.1 TetR family transcriptional regulator [Nocardia asteroides]